MDLLVDLFGYLGILLHGLVIVAQSMLLGSVLYLVLLIRPFASRIADGVRLHQHIVLMAAWSAMALLMCEVINLGMQTAVLSSTLELPVLDILNAQFAVAGLIKAGTALAMAVLLFMPARAPGALLLGIGGIELAAATMTTHAAARLESSAILLVIEALHQLGAAIWIGGVPAFVLTLAGLRDGAAFRLVGARFSRMSMAGVACILVSGVTMAIMYVGSWRGLYSTAYGVMVCAKIALFAMLLLLGLGNFLVVERLRADPAAPILRLRRFAEAEIGIGFTLFFAAASLTSVAPTIDQPRQDQVSWAEIVQRNKPVWPRLHSPDHGSLALIAEQTRLDHEADVAHAAMPEAAFVPGAGVLPPRNAEDIAWSEYNHHWAGVFLLLCGVFALIYRCGVRWARHWPLVFLGLAGFLFLRSDPEVWPLGTEGLIASLRDIEVLQHRIFVLLLTVFALFEWRVRVGNLRGTRAELVFPLMMAFGGALLLTHSHAVANVKDALLIELTHTPLALAAVVAGWSRWLEIRADGQTVRIASWTWPISFLFIGLLLLNYREA